MAINKKGSRNINVDGVDFRWRATGNDGWITVVIWPDENENCRIVGQIGYHHHTKTRNGSSTPSFNQIVVTNRMIREIILHCTPQKLLSYHGQINLGAIEDIYNVDNAVRANQSMSTKSMVK